MAVLAAPVVKDTGWSQQWVYRSLLLGILISGLLAPKVGREVARTGGRMILASGGLVIALGLVLLALAPNLPCFVLAWVVIGVGMALGLYDPLFATYGENARSAITLDRGIHIICGATRQGGPVLTTSRPSVASRPQVSVAKMASVPSTNTLNPRACSSTRPLASMTHLSSAKRPTRKGQPCAALFAVHQTKKGFPPLLRLYKLSRLRYFDLFVTGFE
jgi:hypothetical protein